MYKRPSKRTKLFRLIAVYAVMVLAVVTITTFVIFFVLGFRFNRDDGQVEQYAFLQFKSVPSGAAITVDGEEIGSKTPSKTSVPAGTHTVVISKEGYKDWVKTVHAKAGVITWLNYALLVPSEITLESVEIYGSVYSTLASPGGRYVLLQENSTSPTFDLVDISSDKIKTTKQTIPANLYSEANYYGVNHSFRTVEWDEGERFVLVEHKYADKTEWLILDTQSVESTRNVSAVFSSPISDIDFLGTSGNVFYVLSQANLYKVELSSKTISKSLVGNVVSFDIFDDLNVISYTGTSTGGRVVGIYRDGDEESYVLRTLPSVNQSPLNIAVTHYFNEDYVAISEGKKVYVLSGNYPDSEADVSVSLKRTASFSFDKDITSLSFSPEGEYVFVGNGDYFETYDIEYQTITPSGVAGTSSDYSVDWLDANHLWMIRDGSLKISDFDGNNTYEINAAVFGQFVKTTANGRYLYSIGKTDTGYKLQRVRLILP